MRISKASIAGLIMAASSLSIFAQINLSYINSQSARDGKWTSTKVDSVIVETSVGNGVATTLMTFTLEPQGYKACSYKTMTIDTTLINGVASYSYRNIYVCPESETRLDSVEMTCGINLPTDFTAKNLYLWVNGKRQTAYIQDRSLANQQYTQIVGRRRDPALLEYWGNGSYNLRIFPAKSYQARKVAIEFQHTFDDDSAELITARIPLTFDLLLGTGYYAYGIGSALGYIRVTCSATDDQEYAFSMDGVGKGMFSAIRPLVLEQIAVAKLGSGTITAMDPSGNQEFLWTGYDKYRNATIGFSTMLSESTVVREPEPDTRIIVLDVGQETWDWNDYYQKQSKNSNQDYAYNFYSVYTPVNIWQRAQKFAVLCLQNYVGKNQKFNLILTQVGKKQPSPVFNAPVPATCENLLLAYQAIIGATTSKGTRIAALTSALSQAGKGIVFFINDLYQPYDYYTLINNRYETTSNGKAYDALLDSVSRLIQSSGAWLFTISDDGRLSSIASTSGGFRLASLRWDYNCRIAPYTALDNQRKNRIELPAIFGGNYQGITVISVVAPDDVTDCAYTTDRYNYSYMVEGNPMMMLDKKKALSKATSLVLPYGYYGASALFRLAGRVTSNQPSKAFEFTVKGKMGGLGFTKKISASAGTLTGRAAAEQYNVEWALIKSEQLANAAWYNNADAIKAIGLDYHIVTRQTSMLALEPGVDLWKDTILQSATGNLSSGVNALSPELDFASVKRSVTMQEPGASLDSQSLADLIAGKTAVLNDNPVVKSTEIQVKSMKGKISVSMPRALAGKEMTLSLYSLQGRLVFFKTIAAGALKSSAFEWDISGDLTPSKGFYIAKVRIGSIEKVASLPIIR